MCILAFNSGGKGAFTLPSFKQPSSVPPTPQNQLHPQSKKLLILYNVAAMVHIHKFRELKYAQQLIHPELQSHCLKIAKPRKPDHCHHTSSSWWGQESCSMPGQSSKAQPCFQSLREGGGRGEGRGEGGSSCSPHHLSMFTYMYM